MKAIVAVHGDLRRLAELRFRLGLDNALAVKEATADHEAAITRQAGVRDHLDVQRHLLARLVGTGPDDTAHLLAGPSAIIPARIPVPAHLSLGLLSHRPDLAAALYRADSAARMVTAAHH